VNTFEADGLISRDTWPGGTAQSVFYQFDEHGNTVHRLDVSGNVLTSHQYDAYGLETTAVIAGGHAHDDPFDGFGAQYGYYADSPRATVL